MATVKVVFEYRTGVKLNVFRNVRLMGGWTPDGRRSEQWRTVLMKPFMAEDGCPAFRAEVELADSEVGREFTWGVILDVQGRPNIWGIMTEDGPLEEAALHRTFTLAAEGSVERYWLTHCRRLGANKFYPDHRSEPSLQFSVWAPHARQVETVFPADEAGGYIYDDGRGAGRSWPMTRDDEGLWRTDPDEPGLADFEALKNQPYLYRLTRADGSVVYRTDIFSRHQIGTGDKDPETDGWNGRPDDLNAPVSCSVVVDPEMVTERKLEGDRPEVEPVDDDLFWANEFNPLRPLPSRVEEMVIYEMHIGGLGAGHEGPGTLKDAAELLDYLVDLGINAIELMPMSEFDGRAGWGYGTSHFFAIKYDRGNRDQFKHFVRACHQHGIAVIMDVVYNHYTPDSRRAEWMYDSPRHDENIYYFYEGSQDDYPDSMPEGGYCDNQSTGYLPNMRQEMVRKMLISSAAAMVTEFHIDGFRVDLTQALHSYNVLHYDGRPVVEANEAGIRFMREWVRTLRLFKPFVVLIAEDHSGWKAMTKLQELGGIGFDAVWWAEWYHQLIGDATEDRAKARLLRETGFGGDFPLKMDLFGEMLRGSPRRVVYHSSHDEAGNSQGSARNMEVAVNHLLTEETRPWAEARCRAAAGLTILSAGTPMFFMGEEAGAREPYRYHDFLEHREDFPALREGDGARMFRFYQDLIRLRLWSPAFRSPSVDVLHAHNEHRVLVFRRWWGDEEYVVAVSLNNRPFDHGYNLVNDYFVGRTWTEVLNSDADLYGGWGVSNPEELSSLDGRFNPRLPACGLAVFARIN